MVMKYLGLAAVAATSALAKEELEVEKLFVTQRAVTNRETGLELLKKLFEYEEYSPLCEYEEWPIYYACTDQLNWDFANCEEFKDFMPGILSCIEQSCGVVCEEREDQFENVVTIFEDFFFGGTCDAGPACAMLDPYDYEPPPPPEYPGEYEPICLEEDQLQAAIDCLNEQAPPPIFDCVTANHRIAVYAYCVGTFCERSCEELDEFYADALISIEEQFGCGIEHMCDATFPPDSTDAPTGPIITYFPTTEPTARPTEQPVESPTAPPTTTGGGDGGDGDTIALIIIAGLVVVIILLSVALVSVMCMKKQQATLVAEKYSYVKGSDMI